eukprot:jgi/Bigna1/78114/fgenesh1_pg.52_\
MSSCKKGNSNLLIIDEHGHRGRNQVEAMFTVRSMASRMGNMFSRRMNFSWSSPRPVLARLLRKSAMERKVITRGGFAAAVASAAAYVASESLSRAEELGVHQPPNVYLPTNDQAYDFRIFSGNGNPVIVLANEIAMRLGCQLGRAIIGSFQDGEVKFIASS